jgi:hypothetical protein
MKERCDSKVNAEYDWKMKAKEGGPTSILGTVHKCIQEMFSIVKIININWIQLRKLLVAGE